MRKRRNALIGTALLATMVLAGCGNKEAVTTTEAESKPTSVIEYEYSEKTKTSIYYESKPEEVMDISEYVTNFSSGELFLTLDGYESVFGLGASVPTEEETTLFEQYENENDFEGDFGDIIKISNDEHTILFRNGSSLYLADGELKTFTEPPITTNEQISLSLFDIVFSLGYDSIGTTIGDGDSLTYIINDMYYGEVIETDETIELIDDAKDDEDSIKVDPDMKLDPIESDDVVAADADAETDTVETDTEADTDVDAAADAETAAVSDK